MFNFISDFQTNGKEQSKELYTIGLHYYDIMCGLKDSKTELSPSVSTQKIQITRRTVEEKEMANSVQNFYLRLLGRYLKAKHGDPQGESLMHKYNQALQQLREMREILVEKSLQF